MTSPSPKMGLAIPSQSDNFSTADIANNWTKIDGSPGTYICSSTTRPTDWTPAQNGRKIFETDTDLEWVWDGAAFQRLGPVGLLKRNDGTWAVGERTTDFTTSNSGSMVVAVSITSVMVPAGNRPIRIECFWNKSTTTVSGSTHAGTINRSKTNDSGTVEARWQMGLNIGGSQFAIIRAGLAPGSYDWSFQVNSPGGTTTISATGVSPISIVVTEL